MTRLSTASVLDLPFDHVEIRHPRLSALAVSYMIGPSYSGVQFFRSRSGLFGRKELAKDMTYFCNQSQHRAPAGMPRER